MEPISTLVSVAEFINTLRNFGNDLEKVVEHHMKSQYPNLNIKVSRKGQYDLDYNRRTGAIKITLYPSYPRLR